MFNNYELFHLQIHFFFFFNFLMNSFEVGPRGCLCSSITQEADWHNSPFSSQNESLPVAAGAGLLTQTSSAVCWCSPVFKESAPKMNSSLVLFCLAIPPSASRVSHRKCSAYSDCLLSQQQGDIDGKMLILHRD